MNGVKRERDSKWGCGRQQLPNKRSLVWVSVLEVLWQKSWLVGSILLEDRVARSKHRR